MTDAPHDTLATYRSRLDDLEKEPRIERLAALEILLERTRLGREIDQGAIDSALVLDLSSLDAMLRRHASKIITALDRAKLTSWRETAGARDDHWWWHLQKPAASDAVYNWLTGLLFALTISFAALISGRFFEGGADAVGALALAVQGILGAIAGASFVKSGHAAFSRLGVPMTRHSLAGFAAALAAFLAMLLLFLSLPTIAGLYNEQGLKARAAGNVSQAIERYERAVRLSPGHVQSLYDLGDAYEEVGDYDKAIQSYRDAIGGDASFYHAYSNLSRLLILHKKDYNGALTLLAKAWNLHPSEQEVRFSMRKNRAWANLMLNHLAQADADAREAATSDQQSGAPHCLLAQIAVARHEDAAAETEWRACSSLGGRGVEAFWLEAASDWQLRRLK